MGWWSASTWTKPALVAGFSPDRLGAAGRWRAGHVERRLGGRPSDEVARYFLGDRRADRITANGDVANKIGTYQLAVLAMHHGVRFMVVAPSSTIDMALESGDEILLEERAGSELLEVNGQRFAAEIEVFNPVFDVTPADLIDAIVTEKGWSSARTPRR